LSDSLAVATAAYAAGLALWLGLRAARGLAPSREHAAAAIVIELATLGQAIAAAAGLADGHEPSNLGVLIAYLATSVLLLPILWPAAASDQSPWGSATLALACVAIAVVALRAIDVWSG
jgi:hypothetical protein